MKRLFSSLILVTSVTFFSCGTSMQEYKGTSADLASQVLQKTEQNEPENVGKSVERKIIKEGQLSFETAKVSETKNLIVSAVQELNGYISKDNVNDYSDRLEHRLVIRIPSEKFDLLLNKVSESAEKLDSKNIDVIDVTEEYIDIDTRIKTKKELENRYKELLKQATKIDEILSIERELAQLRSDIESVEGRMNYLKDRISYSTLTVTYYQKTASAFRFTSQFGQALKQGWSSFLWFLIGLTHLWTFILIAGVTGAYFFFRYKRNKNKKVR